MQKVLSLATLCLFVILTVATHTANRKEVFVDGSIYFTDADCYSRMTRVERLIKHPIQRIDRHDFENFPEGTRTHATAPMDYAIAVIVWLLAPFVANPLDLAGAVVSPMLAVLLIVLLWWWGRELDLSYRNAMLLLVAVSPILVHGFNLGRPDHQSLSLFPVGMALAAEWAMWTAPRRRWAALGGIAWGLALWVTRYEPLVLIAAVLAARFAILRREAAANRWAPFWIALAVVCAVSLVFDGWRAHALPPETVQYFANWSKTIGELQGTAPWSGMVLGWCGWLILPAPLLLAWRWYRAGDRIAMAKGALLVLVYALTAWQTRWGYFLALVFAMSLPEILGAMRSRATAWTVFAVSLLPVAQEWDLALFPRREQIEAAAERRKDYALLRQVASSLVSNERTPILAPWWLSPPLAYWSGQPCVAGSSHQSLPGIVDTARFYLTSRPSEALDILRRRGVRYVIAYEPSRVLGTSSILLNRTPPPNAIGQLLYDSPGRAPAWLAPVLSNEFFKVYEVIQP